jgi:hypothetical protein
MPPPSLIRNSTRSAYRLTPVSGAPWLRLFPFAIILPCLISFANSEAVPGSEQHHRISTPENPEVSSALVEVVDSFIAAGEKDDPSARGKYLAPKVFFYGRARTREQALKVIASLYRRWPQRKFTPTEAVDLFEIPNHRGVYRVIVVYEYIFDNQGEHLSGKSKLNCVVEHDLQGTRIIGVDEKLVGGSTDYQRE